MAMRAPSRRFRGNGLAKDQQDVTDGGAFEELGLESRASDGASTGDENLEVPNPECEPRPQQAQMVSGESIRWTSAQRFVVFGAVGLSVMVVGGLLLYFLIEQVGLPLIVAYPTQVFVAINLNFLLNYRITWSDRRSGVDPDQHRAGQWLKFVSGRLVMIFVSSGLFSLVVWRAHYLVAHVVSIAIPAVLNYVFSDRIVFAADTKQSDRSSSRVVDLRESTAIIIDLGDGASFEIGRDRPSNNLTVDLSVILPVKGNQDTIRETVQSLLSQTFAGEYEVIAVVDRDDPAHAELHTVSNDARLLIVHPDSPFPCEGRDSNWRRGLGLRVASGSALALTDADMILAPNWAQTGVNLLADTGADCVAGVMVASNPRGFWHSYVDTNALGAKTPRYAQRTMLTSQNFGRSGTKPGVTANMFFTREMYQDVGTPRYDFLHTYEDYAFFYDIVSAGHQVLCTPELRGGHHHRDSLRALFREYVASGLGCADFVWAYPRSPLSRNRLIQAVVIVLGSLFAAAGVFFDPAMTVGLLVLGLVLVGISNACIVRSMRSVVFPLATLALGLIFTAAFLRGLVRRGPPTLGKSEVSTSVTIVRRSGAGERRAEAVEIRA